MTDFTFFTFLVELCCVCVCVLCVKLNLVRHTVQYNWTAGPQGELFSLAGPGSLAQSWDNTRVCIISREALAAVRLY